MSSNFVGGKKASEILSVHQNTLYKWEKKGYIKTIRTDGGKRLYDVESYLNKKKEISIVPDDSEKIKNQERLKICYCRVSTHEQKNDLERQIKELKFKYPNHYFLTDIGSGINFNRRSLTKILDFAIEGKIEELVIAHKDRLTRFGFELFERLIEKYSKGKIIILHKKKDLDPEEELVSDVLQILNVFTAKMNGLRKYKKFVTSNKNEC